MPTATPSRRLPAKWQKLLRMIPGYDSIATAGDAWFDVEAAQHALDFFPQCLTHVKGEKGGQPFVLEPWLAAVTANIFGWKQAKDIRRYREVLLYVPRKNAKTFWSAGIVLYLLNCDVEPGAEIYCLDPATRVLSAEDLRWRPIGALEGGEYLVGVDEHPMAKGSYRKLRKTQVLGIRRQKDTTLRLIFENGASVVCTPNHRWLCRPPHGGGLTWQRAGHLGVGWKIRHLLEPWQDNLSREAGYLAGVFDGEASFHAPRAVRAAVRMQFVQNPGVVLEETARLLRQLGFATQDPLPMWSGRTMHIELGGMDQCLRFLGEIRPLRFLEKHQQLWEDKATTHCGSVQKIVAIEYAGQQEVVDIHTDTGTFLAEGFVSHNSAAADRDQATLVYAHAKGMVLQEPELARRNKIYETAKAIVREDTQSSYKVISADANTKHGFNSHAVVIDELHAQPNRELVDVLMTSTGSRRQPLILHTTTSDFERPSICNEKYDYACKVRDGIIDDSSFLPVIYEAKLTDDWTDPKVWAMANPNLGKSVSLEYMQRECKRAQETPSFQNTFKRLHLNIKTEQDVRWLAIEAWDACLADALDDDELRPYPCFAGLDLASTADLCALALYFPDLHAVRAYFWLPEETADLRLQRARVPYPAWIQQGFITATEGNVADYDRIRLDINALAKQFQIKELAYDRWGATQLITQLQGDGITSAPDGLVPYGQGFASMSAPAKELERLILSQELRQDGNPVLRWCVSNVMIETDAAGNVKPSKRKSSEKIDGVVALTMAIGRAIVQAKEEESVYNSRGLLVL